MFHLGKLIYGSPFILFLIIGLVVSTSSSKRETKKALNTISRFLRSKPGTTWLAGLAQMKSGPLTTAELMDQLIKAAKPDGNVSKSAKILRKTLEIQKQEEGGADDISDAWDDLIEDIQNQDGIICLYRKDSDTSMRKADDWKKFLKSVSNGYTVYLALDKGKKYVICMKKISVPEGEDTTSLSEITTQENPLEMTSMKVDLEERTEADEKSDDNKEATTTDNIVDTTELNQISEIGEKSEPGLKLLETRKSKFGPSIKDIKKTEIEEDSEEDSEEDCSSEEDETNDDREESEGADEDKNRIEKTVNDRNLDPNHPQCNRPIILVMQNPYGSPGNPNWLYFNPQIPKNPLQTLLRANQLPKFIYPAKQSTLNPSNTVKRRYPANILNQDPKGYSINTGILPENKTPFDRKRVLGLNNSNLNISSFWIPQPPKKSQPLKNSQLLQNLQPFGQNFQPFEKYRPSYQLRISNHNSKPPGRYLEKPEEKLEPASWYLENSKLPSKKSTGQMTNIDLRSRNGPNLVAPLIPNRPNYLNNWNRYNPLMLNSPLNPPAQKCFQNLMWKPLIRNQENISGRFGKMQWNLNPYGWNKNLRMVPKYSWLNQPNNQQRPYNQQIFPNNQGIFLRNHQGLSNTQPNFSNSETSVKNPNSCKCPSLCDKPIELKITIEGNVDKPVKVGVLSQPGTWVNIVDNNEGNSRRMLKTKENISENDTEGNDRQEGAREIEDDSKSTTENFDEELIQNSDKTIKKNETDSSDKNKNIDDPKEKNGNEETDKKVEEEDKAENQTEEEIEGRILPEMTTILNIKPTNTTTEIIVPAT